MACDSVGMKTSTSIQSLEDQIEVLVRAQMAGIRASVVAVVDRALAASSAPARPPGRERPRPRTPGKRRAPGEIAALSERLLAAVTATPGETMATLASRIGSSSRELSRPAAQLKREERLRTVGQRGHTTYFPATAASVHEV